MKYFSYLSAKSKTFVVKYFANFAVIGKIHKLVENKNADFCR